MSKDTTRKQRMLRNNNKQGTTNKGIQDINRRNTKTSGLKKLESSEKNLETITSYPETPEVTNTTSNR